MFEIDKVQFGAFLAEQRKSKGYTQKEIAQRLFVSDKAVSKWETGNSMPDVSLLIPLADLLDVTVTELLTGHEMKKEAEMNANEVETLVKKAISFGEDMPIKEGAGIRRKDIFAYGSCVALSILGVLSILLIGIDMEGMVSTLITFEILSIVFGAYFWLLIKKRLPSYYDEYKISSYSDGIFRMNIVGIYLNNRNWPHIVRAGRIWSGVSLVAIPLAYLAGALIIDGLWRRLWPHMVCLVLYLGGLFVPMMVLGKKYE